MKRWHQKTIVSGVSSVVTSTSTPTLTGAHADADPVDKPILVSNQESGSFQINKPQNLKLQFEVDSVFDSWRSNVSADQAKVFLRERLKECNLKQVCHLMRLLGKKSKSKLHLSLKPHLPAVASHLESFSSKLWSFGNVSAVIHGLQCFEEDDDGYLRIISLVTKIADKSFITKASPSSSEITSIIAGLQKNRVKSLKSREFLSCLTSMVIQSKDEIGSRTVGALLYGLRCMSSDHVEVRLLLSALEPKVRSCRETLDAHALSNALYGLSCMSSDREEVRSVLSALEPLVRSCKELLSVQAVGNALYGLKCMSSDHEEVRSLLSALVPKVRSCTGPLDAQAVGNALYGMRRMSSDCEEVRSLLSALEPKVRSCREPLSVQAVGNGLYGMRCMSSDHEEVRSLLSALEP